MKKNGIRTGGTSGSLLALIGVIGLLAAMAGGVGDAASDRSDPSGRDVRRADSQANLDGILTERANREMGLRTSRVVHIDVPHEADARFDARVRLDDRHVTLALHPHSVRGKDFEVRHYLEDGSWITVDPGPVRTMRGTIPEMPGAVVAANQTDFGIEAYIRTPDGRELWIEPLAHRYLDAEASHHIVYARADLMDTGVRCGVPAKAAMMPDAEDLDPRDYAVRGGGCNGQLCLAEIACDADVEYFQIFGAGTAAQIESIINTVNLQYETQVGITHDISVILVRTAEPDPYSHTEATLLWQQFRNHWNANHGGIQRDTAQLFTGKVLNGITVGFAHVGGMCSTQSYSLVRHRPEFSRATDLSAHELGHIWNAQHCDCPNHTMNPTLTGANTFHPTLTIPTIISFRNSRTCLEPAESEMITLPFTDNFPTTTINSMHWTGYDRAYISTLGANPPSAPYVLTLDGTAVIRSARIDASMLTDIRLAYFSQKGGLGDRPEIGEDLILEYQNAQNSWVEINRHAGGGFIETTFSYHMVVLPPEASHPSLRIRFRTVAPSPGIDHWHIDNLSFTATSALPGAFSLSSPAAGAGNISTTPTLSWTASQAASNYRIIIDDDPAFASPIVDAITPSTGYTVSGTPLDQATVYHWKVTAINDAGMTPSTPETRSFTTTGPLPSAFNLVAPTNGGTVDSTTPTFVWNASANAQSYTIKISQNSNMSSPFINVSGLTFDPGHSIGTYTPAEGLLIDGQQYYWRIEAWNVIGPRIGSPTTASFTVEVEDEPPVGECPGDVDGNEVVNTDDITYIILRLGLIAPNDQGADVDGNGVVNIDDITFVILRMGSCTEE